MWVQLPQSAQVDSVQKDLLIQVSQAQVALVQVDSVAQVDNNLVPQVVSDLMDLLVQLPQVMLLRQAQPQVVSAQVDLLVQLPQVDLLVQLPQVLQCTLALT
jgi:hypothetical protein